MATEKKQKIPGGITGKGYMPGVSGNPGGRPKGTPIRDMYWRILSNPANLDAIEAATLKAATKGNMAMVLLLKEIADRVEGKVTQPIEADISVNLADAIAAARKRAGK